MWHFDTLALISYFEAGNFLVRPFWHGRGGGGGFCNTLQNRPIKRSATFFYYQVMCKTDSLTPSLSFTSSLSLEGRDWGSEVGVGGRGGNGRHEWSKAQRRDEGWDRGSGTIWQAKPTPPGVMCSPHLLIFERPLIILGTLSVHSLRILLFLD